MNSSVDCAVFSLPLFHPWTDQVTARLGPDSVNLHRIPLAQPEEDWATDLRPRLMYDDRASRALARHAHALQRFDVCLLPVVPRSLAWTRVALANAERALPVPLVLLGRALNAPAIRDLLRLGASDFLLSPFSTEELKARLVQWATRHRQQFGQGIARFPSAHGGPGTGQSGAPRTSTLPGRSWPVPAAVTESVGACNYGDDARAYQGLRDAADAAWPSEAGSTGACRRPRPSPQLIAETVRHLTAPPPVDNSYRATRARVIEQFEREYVTSMLLRYRGNVTHAARAGNQDRRAFWQLMRKYRIASADFRTGRSARAEPRG